MRHAVDGFLVLRVLDDGSGQVDQTALHRVLVILPEQNKFN